MKQQNKKAYTIIVVILIIGFLMVLTIGILKLVMDEMKDNKSLGNYQKAYIAAESAQELALLQIKEKGYGYNEEREKDFSENVLSIDPTKPERGDPVIHYTNKGTVKKYKGTLAPLENAIMPLFVLTKDTNTIKESTFKPNSFSLGGTGLGEVSWNIVGSKGGTSGVGGFSKATQGKQKGLNSEENLYFDEGMVGGFLQNSATNYLLLFNSGDLPVDYTIEAAQNFTKPQLEIISTAQVGNYKQNIQTTVNYADIVNRAKYSIYSD